MPETTPEDINPDLEDLLWVREQLREAIPELRGREKISALEAYRKLIGQIASLKKALNTGEAGAAGKLESLVGDAPNGGTEGPWDDPAEVRAYDGTVLSGYGTDEEEAALEDGHDGP